MESIFDGIQRPLDFIAEMTQSIYIPRGINIKSLNRTKLWAFTPIKKVIFIFIRCMFYRGHLMVPYDSS